jgi:uncharacterized protein
MSQPAKVPEIRPPETRAAETRVPDASVPEPSIDEILASIRRSIVPDDDADRPPAAATRKSGSRKAGPASGARGRRADGDGARAGSDATAGRGADRAAERGAASGACDASAPADQVGLGEDDAHAAEIASGWGDENNASGHPAITATMLSGQDDAIASANSIPNGSIPKGASPNGLVPDAPLLSPRTTAAVDTAFNSLTHTVLSQGPRTLEDLVREMLKPMLKAWLDAHLPDMVERLVRAEIERVSRRGPR